MRFATNWIFNFYFLITLSCLSQNSAATVEAWFGEKDKVLGKSEPRLTVAASVKHCAVRCLPDVECQAYQYIAHEQQNCALLYSNSTEDGSTFESNQHSQLYQKKISGVACLAIPNSCSEGGALSVWIKIDNCAPNGGIISSSDDGSGTSQGFRISCQSGHIMYVLSFPASFVVSSTSISTEWFHLVLNYLGPNPDQGATIYHNSVEKATGQNINQVHRAGSGIVVLGRFDALQSGRYSSVMIDELMLFNRKLTMEEVAILYNVHN